MSQNEFYSRLIAALRLYYELKKKPQQLLDIHDRLHISNMEFYAECQNLAL